MNGDVAQAGAPSAPGLKKADPSKRVIAFIIDAVCAAVVSWIPVAGGIIGAAYMLLRDDLPVEALGYKSVGKKLMNLSVVLEANPTAKLDFPLSAKRNWMFAIGPIMATLTFLPVIGWVTNIILGFALLILGIMEVMKVFNDPKGQRMGDTMAGTMVIEDAPKTA